MYSAATWSVTPRPMYPADGRKIPDIYTQPAELRDELNARLGPFPLFQFWGPAADLASSRWIADCARHVYDTQAADAHARLPAAPRLRPPAARARAPGDRAGPPGGRRALRRADRARAAGRDAGGRAVRVRHHAGDRRHPRQPRAARGRAAPGARRSSGASSSTPAPPRRSRWRTTRSPTCTCGGRSGSPEVKRLLEGLPGVERVLDEDGKRAAGLDHPRSGELVAVSRADRWFTYYYWLDDARAPDFARTVDIHRKPGYDPVELFLDPALRVPKASVGWRLAKKALGFRYLMDVIPLDASLVKGSHGRPTDDLARGPARHLERAGPAARGSDRRDRGQGSPAGPRVRTLTRPSPPARSCRSRSGFRRPCSRASLSGYQLIEAHIAVV